MDPLTKLIRYLNSNAIARQVESAHSIRLACMLRGDMSCMEAKRAEARLTFIREKFPVTHSKFFQLLKEC